MRLQQLPVQVHLPFQGTELGVSALDQCDKLANHARAFASKGCESLVLICANASDPSPLSRTDYPLRLMLNPVRNIDSSASNVNQMLRNGG